jgi:alkanesulfonate monooxygenase SsuD/methylene tetrahydromethanopterin reductase-like flavin-dependent oxidoreductase (luciferase family)
MKVSYHPLFGNLAGLPDDELVRNDLRLLDLAEPLGFDSIMCVEHHFDRPYSALPDNFQLLAYMAGRTTTIELGLSAIILPWHNPLRVIEQICLLDHLSEGRVMVGFGRGLSKLEYDGYGIDMAESRERFDEAAEMVLRALRTGYAEGEGKFYPQRRVEIVPGPTRSFEDRLYCIGMSPDSCEAAGHIGGGLACFTQWPIEQHMPMINTYRETFAADHSGEAPPVLMSDFTFCSLDGDEARRKGREYGEKYFATTIRHYDFAGDNLGKTKGYESYDEAAKAIRAAGMEAATEAWAEAQIFGTPEEIVERYRKRMEVTGSLRAGVIFNFGGMPIEEAEASMRLYGEQVLPELQRMGADVVTA